MEYQGSLDPPKRGLVRRRDDDGDEDEEEANRVRTRRALTATTTELLASWSEMLTYLATVDPRPAGLLGSILDGGGVAQADVTNPWVYNLVAGWYALAHVSSFEEMAQVWTQHFEAMPPAFFDYVSDPVLDFLRYTRTVNDSAEGRDENRLMDLAENEEKHGYPTVHFITERKLETGQNWPDHRHEWHQFTIIRGTYGYLRVRKQMVEAPDLPTLTKICEDLLDEPQMLRLDMFSDTILFKMVWRWINFGARDPFYVLCAMTQPDQHHHRFGNHRERDVPFQRAVVRNAALLWKWCVKEPATVPETLTAVFSTGLPDLVHLVLRPESGLPVTPLQSQNALIASFSRVSPRVLDMVLQHPIYLDGHVIMRRLLDEAIPGEQTVMIFERLWVKGYHNQNYIDGQPLPPLTRYTAVDANSFFTMTRQPRSIGVVDTLVAKGANVHQYPANWILLNVNPMHGYAVREAARHIQALQYPDDGSRSPTYSPM